MMMLDHQGFGELLAAGPEAAWGYVGNSTGVGGVPGLSDRSGYAGPPTTAEEDRTRAGRGREEEGRNVQQLDRKAGDWASG